MRLESLNEVVSMPLRQVKVRLPWLVLLLVLAFLTANARLNTRLERLSEPLTLKEVASSVPPMHLLQAASLGHREAVSDLLWIDALSYVGGGVLIEDPIWLYPHLDAITTLDPLFSPIYEWAATMVMYAGRINNTSVRSSIEILERGIERFPDDWQLHFMLAINHLFELQITDNEERLRHQQLGMEQLEIASRLPGAPPFVLLAVTSLSNRAGNQEQTFNAAVQGYLSAADQLHEASQYEFVDRLSPPIESANLVRERRVRTGTPTTLWREINPEIALNVHPEPLYLYGTPPLESLLYHDQP